MILSFCKKKSSEFYFSNWLCVIVIMLGCIINLSAGEVEERMSLLSAGKAFLARSSGDWVTVLNFAEQWRKSEATIIQAINGKNLERWIRADNLVRFCQKKIQEQQVKEKLAIKVTERSLSPNRRVELAAKPESSLETTIFLRRPSTQRTSPVPRTLSSERLLLNQTNRNDEKKCLACETQNPINSNFCLACGTDMRLRKEELVATQLQIHPSLSGMAALRPQQKDKSSGQLNFDEFKKLIRADRLSYFQEFAEMPIVAKDGYRSVLPQDNWFSPRQDILSCGNTCGFFAMANAVCSIKGWDVFRALKMAIHLFNCAPFNRDTTEADRSNPGKIIFRYLAVDELLDYLKNPDSLASYSDKADAKLVLETLENAPVFFYNNHSLENVVRIKEQSVPTIFILAVKEALETRRDVSFGKKILQNMHLSNEVICENEIVDKVLGIDTRVLFNGNRITINELYEAFNKALPNTKNLMDRQRRLAKLDTFDSAAKLQQLIRSIQEKRAIFITISLVHFKVIDIKNRNALVRDSLAFDPMAKESPRNMSTLLKYFGVEG